MEALARVFPYPPSSLALLNLRVLTSSPPMHLPKTACLLRTPLPREPLAKMEKKSALPLRVVWPNLRGLQRETSWPTSSVSLPVKWSEGITRVTSAFEAPLWVWTCPLKEETVQPLSCVWLFATPSNSMPGLPVHHQLPEPAQTHVNWVGDAIQPAHPLSSPSAPAFNLSQHQHLFQWVSSSHQVAKGLELKLQLQSFQWIFRTDFP